MDVLVKDNKVINAPKVSKKRKNTAFEHMKKKAMLVKLTRRQLSNYIFDIKNKDDIIKKYGVKNKEFIIVTKTLFNPQHLLNIRSAANDAQLLMLNVTRPWDNIEYRLLPMGVHADFTKTFSKIKDTFEEEVQKFIDNYDAYIKEAQDTLGKLFNKINYPVKSDLKDYFELSIKTKELSDIDDVRLNLSNEDLNLLINDELEEYQDKIDNAFNRLINLVNPQETKQAINLWEIAYNLKPKDNKHADTLANIKKAILNAGAKEEDFFKKKEKLKENKMLMVNDDEDTDNLDDDDLQDFL